MNNRARQIWREHAEELFHKYKEITQHRYAFMKNLSPEDKKYTEIADKLYKKFYNIEKLLGEELHDWKN